MAARILVADDAAFMRKLLVRSLVAAGFEVVGEACNGAQAVQMYLSLLPDLLTLDMVMPEMNGMEAMRRVREIDPKAKVLIVSAVDQRENLLEAIRNGACDYIVKPFDAERVQTAVQRALGITPAAAGTH